MKFRIKHWIAISVVVLFASCSAQEMSKNDEMQKTETVERTQERTENIEEDGIKRTTFEQIEETATIEEISLANEAVLLIEKQLNNTSKISIRVNDSITSEFLLYDWDSQNYKISPDLTKIAYILHSDKSDSGYLHIFDVLENESTLLIFDEYPEQYESKGMIWLDNEILLTIGLQNHYGWSVGGSVFYYNTTNGENKRIIPHDISSFQITGMDIIGNKLSLKLIYNGESHYATTFNDYQNIPLTRIYELIMNGENYTLDVPDAKKEFLYYLCECNVCESLFLNQGTPNFIVHPRGASDGRILHNSNSCSDLQLVERAIKLFVDLDSDFNDTVEQIKFGYSPYAEKFINYYSGIYSIEEYISSVFENDLLKILNVNIYQTNEENLEYPLFITNLYVSFEQWGRADGICVEFAKINGEWVVNNLYADIIMQ